MYIAILFFPILQHHIVRQTPRTGWTHVGMSHNTIQYIFSQNECGTNGPFSLQIGLFQMGLMEGKSAAWLSFIEILLEVE